MKKVFGIFAIVLAISILSLSLVAKAEPKMATVTLTLTNVSTNATAGTVTDYIDSDVAGGIYGLIENIIVDFSGATSPDVDIDITTVANKGTGAARTIYSVDDQSADETIVLRSAVKNTAGSAITNEGGKLALSGDQVRFQVYDANKTNVNVKVYIVYSQP